MKLGIAALGMSVAVAIAGVRQAPPAPMSGVALSELSWTDAEAWLTPSAVVVIPLGGGAVEHGPHMKLDSDERLARYLASRVRAAANVVVAPAVTYHDYGSYAEYPGSTSLEDATARGVIVDAVRSLARPGPRRFYVLNTSRATMASLNAAAKTLADDGILLGYTDPEYWTRNSPVLKQSPLGVGHAEEAATSMMLFVDPSAVDMRRAEREYSRGTGALTRQDTGRGVYSKSGILGDATLATKEKGQVLVERLVAGALSDIEGVRSASLPPVRTAPPVAPRPPAPRPAPGLGTLNPNSGCTEGDERAIRKVGEMFTYLWAQADAEKLAGLWTGNGDIRHPDGSIERGFETLYANRRELFARREYRGSTHPVALNDVRCVGADVAIADGKWELRLVSEPPAVRGGLAPAKLNNGWCTLVMRKTGAWQIEAWRYTVDPPRGTPPPLTLPKPGFLPGRGGG